jgi:phage RecT family recombinase
MNEPAAAQRGATTTTERQGYDPVKVLNDILDNTNVNARVKIVGDALDSRIAAIEELLPGHMKGQGMKLAKRAMLTLSRTPDLEKCSPQDFIRCVLDGAALGIAIDGKLGYVVPYKGKYQFQADYKAIIAVARRNKLIDDCYAELVCEHDEFDFGHEDAGCWMKHHYEPNKPRGQCIGAWCKIILSPSSWRIIFMPIAELNRIKARAPSQNGPWKTDEGEMFKKTAIRRALKTYIDDPSYIQALAEPGEDEIELIGTEEIKTLYTMLDEAEQLCPDQDQWKLIHAAFLNYLEVQDIGQLDQAGFAKGVRWLTQKRAAAVRRNDP